MAGGDSGHGHGHGHHAEHTFKVPDWRQYKIDGIKELEWTQKKLAEKGLRDPWLRNEVWRYKHWPGFGKMALMHFARGFKWAFGAMVLTVAVDRALGISKSKHDHHHQSHDAHGHHEAEQHDEAHH